MTAVKKFERHGIVNSLPCVHLLIFVAHLAILPNNDYLKIALKNW